MTYTPRHLTPDQAADALHDGDLIQWREAADLLDIPPRRMTRWMDRGQLAWITVEHRRYVILSQASALEHQIRAAGPGRHARGSLSA